MVGRPENVTILKFERMTSEAIAIAVDHGGFKLKKAAVEEIRAAGFDVVDLGTDSEESVDYPDVVERLIETFRKGDVERGILICGTGIGVSIAANRQPFIRAALCYDEETAMLARQHNDANVVCIGGRKTSEETARRIVGLFLETAFEGGRHARRVAKMS